MSLKKDLIERFQAIYINKYRVVIGFTEAESELKELADIIRLTSQHEGMDQNA